MENNDPELTPTAAAAKDYENNPARYATTPAPKLDRHEMMMGANRLIEPNHRAMLARLREIAANATLHQQVLIDEADLRQLIALADPT